MERIDGECFGVLKPNKRGNNRTQQIMRHCVGENVLNYTKIVNMPRSSVYLLL